MREETERAETIVEGHDHRPLRRQVLAVIPRHAARTTGETATVNPDHHRTTVIGVLGTCPDVRVEAVFTAGGLARRGGGRWSGSRTGSCCASTAAARRSGRTCNTRGSKRVSFAHVVPLRNRL